MARTANRLIDVMALLQVNWVAFRIDVDTVHLQISIRWYALFVTCV
jgi:hypothetical protein